MGMKTVFRSIFWIGIGLSAGSLAIENPLGDYTYFYLFFFSGLVLITYSLFEQWLMKRYVQRLVAATQPAAPAAVTTSAPPQEVIAKRFSPPKTETPPSLQPVPQQKISFFSSFFSHLSRLFSRKPKALQQKISLQRPAIASLDNVKHLFTEDIHLQQQLRAKTFPLPVSKPLAPQQPPPQPAPSPPPLVPKTFQQPVPLGHEDHYIPLGAEQLAHDTTSWYDERLEVSPVPDTRVLEQQPQRLPVTGTPPTPPQQPAAPQEHHDEQLATLQRYVQDCLKQHYPLDKIKEAARSAGWPEALITRACMTTKRSDVKKRLIILGILVASLIILLIVVNSNDLFLLPYLFELLSTAPPMFFIIMIGVFVLVIFIFGMKVRTLVKAKHIEYKIAEEKSVEAIRQELQQTPVLQRGSYQTDFDRLYQLLMERHKLTITEVAQGFNIPRKEAEEWGKILKEQGLLDLHYPTVGEPELRWKK